MENCPEVKVYKQSGRWMLIYNSKVHEIPLAFRSRTKIRSYIKETFIPKGTPVIVDFVNEDCNFFFCKVKGA